MAEEIQLGDRVQVFLAAKNWGSDGWFDGKVVRIDSYSQHRSFYWVELDENAGLLPGTRLLSVLNPKNIRKI
jgi:N-acyl-L-homoserine lactone synthetase